MTRLTRSTLAGVLLGFASAQSQSKSQSALVTQIFFPLADPQPLDASIVAQVPGATTIVMNCATPTGDCGFPDPITLTVGPSTLHYTASGIYQILGDIDCKLTASATADCTVAAGMYSYYAEEPTGTETEMVYITTPALSSSTTSGIFSGSDVSWLDITITAGLEKAAGSAAGTMTATATTTATSGASKTGTVESATGASASRTDASSAEVASATGNVAAGSHQAGYAGLGVAALLVAGSMVIL